MNSYSLISFFFIFCWIQLTWAKPEQPQQQTIQNNTGTAINALGNVDITIIQKSTDYQDLKQNVDKAKRNIAKLPHDPDFIKELQQSERNLNDFIEGVRKLLADIDKISINSERGKEAREYFEKGDYQAARDALDEKEMGEEKKALLKKREQLKKQEEENKAHLDNLAADYIFKAKLTAIDYQLSERRIPQTRRYFEEALELVRLPEYLFEYALFLQNNNQFHDSEKRKR